MKTIATQLIAIAVCTSACGNTGNTDATTDPDPAVALTVVQQDTAATAIEDYAVYDYDRYARLGKCAELVYHSAEATRLTADIERDSILTSRLAEMGITPLKVTDSIAAHRQLAIIARKQCAATSGFKTEAFYDTVRHKYILSFAGTEPQSADIITDIDGSFSMDEPQNRSALNTVSDAIAAISAITGITPLEAAAQMELTGHSLGGRLASVASICYGIDAVVYNPANIPIDLQKQMLTDRQYRDNASRHLWRIHSAGDELTRGMNLGEQIRPLVPAISKALDSGTEWLGDTSSLGTLKSIVSYAPEIAGAADAILDFFTSSDGDDNASGHESNTKIILALIKNMRRYNINADDLQNPLFYRYQGNEVTPTPGRGGHSITRLNNDIDSINALIDRL